jgi:hypothetical protein
MKKERALISRREAKGYLGAGTKVMEGMRNPRFRSRVLSLEHLTCLQKINCSYYQSKAMYHDTTSKVDNRNIEMTTISPKNSLSHLHLTPTPSSSNS